MKFPQPFLLFLGLSFPLMVLAQYIPTAAFLDSTGRMNYQRDEEGNRIPDYSHAGYGGGGIALPQVPTQLTLGPISGDNTAHIQAAIDQVSMMMPDANGFRGALELDTGRYEIHGTLSVATSGVVLRGKGDGDDHSTNTVLIGVGNTPNQRDILVVGGGSSTRWDGQVSGTATFVLTDRTEVGEYQLKIEKPDPYSVGDNIIIEHPCTQEWINAIGGGGGVSEGPWSVGSQPLLFNRRIVDIQDSVITLDVPLYNTLDRTLAPYFVYRYNRAGIVTNVGVEDLRIDIETAGGDDEDHAWNALGLVQVEDAWVRGCTFLHFGLAGVYTNTANRVTIANCRALNPVAQITGARMYNFNLVNASSQVLVRDCHASNGRHHYVSNGTSSVSGCVFLYCTSEAAYNASEGHRRWIMGLLFDNHEEQAVRQNRVLLGLYNRGDYGTAHGWSAAHSVAWNCGMAGTQLVVQKPPTAQNYAVACRGTVSGNGPWPGPAGHIEGTGQLEVEPTSLYLAQLEARLDGLEEVVNDPIGTGIAADPWQTHWQLYPNPSTGQLFISSREQRAFQGSLRDLRGRILTRFSGNGEWQGDWSELSPGYYLIELIQPGQTHWIRWVKA
ncbi:MAG: T9SS type A sorting domain-containing protein [Bacteroidota bacterium]